MVYYKAFAQYTPVPVDLEPIRYKTTIFEGVIGTHTLDDVYTYFESNPQVMILNTQTIPHQWGDPKVEPVVNYTQLVNVWGTTSISSMRMLWDVFGCASDGIGGTFIGEVITPLRGISAYNTR